MSSLLERTARESLRQRAGSLRPDTPARWGKFSAPQMLAHAIQSLGMMTGDVTVAAKPVPWIVRKPPMRQLLIHVLPFPKGLPTAPELLARAPAAGVSTGEAAAWADEQTAFARALDRVGEVAARGTWPPHPAFGPLTAREWGVLQYRHLDHHFRQFGV